MTNSLKNDDLHIYQEKYAYAKLTSDHVIFLTIFISLIDTECVQYIDRQPMAEGVGCT